VPLDDDHLLHHNVELQFDHDGQHEQHDDVEHDS